MRRYERPSSLPADRETFSIYGIFSYINYINSIEKYQVWSLSASIVCGDSLQPPLSVMDSTAALSKFLEECELKSLAIIFDYLKEGIEDPRIRELTEEVVKTSLWQTVHILRAFQSILEERSDGQGA